MSSINTAEGRYVANAGAVTGGEYQYHLKDHLGNVRLTFTTKQETDTLLATMETENASQEEEIFSGVDSRVTFNTANHTPGGNEAIRLNNTRIVGASKSLSVVPGDIINLEVYAYYEGGSGYDNSVGSTALIGAIASAFGGTSGAGGLQVKEPQLLVLTGMQQEISFLVKKERQGLK